MTVRWKTRTRAERLGRLRRVVEQLERRVRRGVGFRLVPMRGGGALAVRRWAAQATLALWAAARPRFERLADGTTTFGGIPIVVSRP